MKPDRVPLATSVREDLFPGWIAKLATHRERRLHAPFLHGFRFLMEQVADIEPKNVLCVFRNPTAQPEAPISADFRFLGYDLVDRECSISALTNCGGFPDVFANSELSHGGLSD